MAEATSFTASSIDMSSIASTLGRRDTGLGSAEIGYDEERAETKSRACVGRTIDDHPEGYPQLAAFLDCDSRKFLMCRSFTYSRIRHLLYCQDELARLQEGLLDQDDEDASTVDGRKLLISRLRYEYRNEQSPQKALMKKIGPKLKEYDDLVERTIRFASLGAPDARDLEGMKGWINQQAPLSREERGHLLGGTDFVALVEKEEECWLDKIVERALAKCFPRDSIFTSPEQRRISDNPSLRLRSKHRIDVLIRIVLTITAVSMLLGPSAVLYTVNEHNFFKLLLIGAFTILFSAALHAFSKARRHENFAATSAPLRHEPAPVTLFEMSNFADDAGSAKKKVSDLIPDLYTENMKVFAKNEGKEKLYIDEVLGNGEYKLRKGDTKGADVLEEVFAEKDLSEKGWG
ncbi:MAG: hypothetical protein ASARMPRED_006524 [Alectoria sarmentosa]|nr:MAG: hypothetical protein ASARMPRED_006524 [Alectoria sarmentosa]